MKSGHKRVAKSVFVVLILIGTAFLGAIGDDLYHSLRERVLDPRPDVHLFSFLRTGPIHCSTPENLKPLTVHKVKFPDGVDEVLDLWIPIKGFLWTHPDGARLYTIIAENRGNAVAETISMKIKFESGSISSVDINNPERIRLVFAGTLGTNVAEFEITKLLKDERQSVHVLTTDNAEIGTIEAWSEDQGTIYNIYQFEITSL